MEGTQALPRILVVEDEPLLRLFNADMLSDAGFDVLEAANADKALRVLETTHGIRVVFTDVEMPGTLDGYALARWVHVNRPAVKTMIVSGRALPRAGDVPATDAASASTTVRRASKAGAVSV